LVRRAAAANQRSRGNGPRGHSRGCSYGEAAVTVRTNVPANALVIRAALSLNNISWVVKFESVSVKTVKRIETTKLRFRQ
jgi:hypothetical protein